MTPPYVTKDPNVFYFRCKYPQGDTAIPDNRLAVAHSLECDDVPGIAKSLLTGWLQSDQASVHSLADRGAWVQGFLYDLTAWHCGGGNQHGTGHEMVGRAAWSAAQWTTPTMIQALHQQAKSMAWKWVHVTMPQYGLPLSARPEWLSLTQIANGACGLCTHNDMRLVYGGTTHTDPGVNFPYAMLKQFIWAEVDALLGATPPPPPPPVVEDLIMTITQATQNDFNTLMNNWAKTPAGAQALYTILNAKLLNVRWGPTRPNNPQSVTSLLSTIFLETEANWNRISKMSGITASTATGVSKIETKLGVR